MAIKHYSSWWDYSPPDFAFQPQLPSYADIVIVGAGFAGLSTAFWLARLNRKSKKPRKIIVLDESPFPGFKSSGRMTGSIYLGSNKTPSAMVDELGEKTAKGLYEYSLKNNTLLESLAKKMSCEAEFNGGLRMGATVKEITELKASESILKDWGLYPVYFNHDQSQHVAINPLAKGSLFIPNEGLFDPFNFVNDIARLLRQNNIWVVYGSRVVDSRVNEKSVPQLELSNGHVLNAGKVIHTTPDTTPGDRVKGFVTPVRETTVCTEPLSEDMEDPALPLMPIELNGGMDSLRLHNRCILMTGGKAGLRQKDPDHGVTNDSAPNPRVLDHLDSTMVRNFPFSNHMDLSHTWTYIEKQSKDGLPLIGELPGYNGHYVNLAYGRNKFGLAFLGSKNLAERILRIKVQNNFNIFSPKRLVRGE